MATGVYDDVCYLWAFDPEAPPNKTLITESLAPTRPPYGVPPCPVMEVLALCDVVILGVVSVILSLLTDVTYSPKLNLGLPLLLKLLLPP